MFCRSYLPLYALGHPWIMFEMSDKPLQLWEYPPRAFRLGLFRYVDTHASWFINVFVLRFSPACVACFDNEFRKPNITRGAQRYRQHGATKVYTQSKITAFNLTTCDVFTPRIALTSESKSTPEFAGNDARPVGASFSHAQYIILHVSIGSQVGQQTTTGTNRRGTKTWFWLSMFLQRAHAPNCVRQPIALKIKKRIFWRTLRTQQQYLRGQVDEVVHRELSTLNP